MRDAVELIVGGKVIRGFKSYSIDADIYSASDAFELEVGSGVTGIELGQYCTLKVNGKVELVGIIESRIRSGDKDGRDVRIGGRDLMGLVVDRYIESFATIKDMTLEQLAKRFLSKIPYVKHCKMRFGDKVKNITIPKAYIMPEPGQKVFDLLHEVAISKGVVFYMEPDGTIVFDKIRERATFLYYVHQRPGDTNVLSYSMEESIARRFSKVTVYGSQQSNSSMVPKTLKISATVVDPDFPLEQASGAILDKPFVAKTDIDAKDPKVQAALLLQQQRFEGRRVRYAVEGHSQNSCTWAINEMCEVDDRVLGLRENMLIYRRTFKLSKEDGATTDIYVGIPGMAV